MIAQTGGSDLHAARRPRSTHQWQPLPLLPGGGRAALHAPLRARGAGARHGHARARQGRPHRPRPRPL